MASEGEKTSPIKTAIMFCERSFCIPVRTDSIFYRLFQTFPRCFFDLMDLPPERVDEYRFASVEVKQLSFRLDGVFLTEQSDRPIYFVEVQFQRDTNFYARFFSEIFLYLYQKSLENDWQGVVIYPSRGIESTNRCHHYREFFDSGRVARFYLDELDDNLSVGLATLQLIVTENAIESGKKLIQQVRETFADSKQPQELLELIETILVYKLPSLSRREIEAMFSIGDLKQTRVYREALEEGIEQGIDRGRIQEKLAMIPRLSALGLSIEQIAETLELEIDRVREILSSLE
jgi:predicted transposase/invertase (TIGR01784 family)